MLRTVSVVLLSAMTYAIHIITLNITRANLIIFHMPERPVPNRAESPELKIDERLLKSILDEARAKMEQDKKLSPHKAVEMALDHFGELRKQLDDEEPDILSISKRRMYAARAKEVLKGGKKQPRTVGEIDLPTTDFGAAANERFQSARTDD